MMKKKIREQEKSKHNQSNKAADNKDNTETSKYAGENNGKETASEVEKDSASEHGKGEDNSDKLSSEVKALTEKLADIQDKYIRLSAEYDNYRKRTLREKMDLSKYAGENIFLKIIPFMDDFERALRHMDTASDCQAIKDGIDLIYNKFSEFLKQNGIKEIESLNSSFDVDLHEAVAKVPVEEDVKKGKVIDVVEKGYYLQDKVLRFSKVVVGE
jgi:molecular chaperone GrpE